jgi:uncharacterized membrane protein YbaN (DUF454 family)
MGAMNLNVLVGGVGFAIVSLLVAFLHYQAFRYPHRPGLARGLNRYYQWFVDHRWLGMLSVFSSGRSTCRFQAIGWTLMAVASLVISFGFAIGWFHETGAHP